MAKKRLKIEAFRPGTHTSSAGQKITFTAEQVRAIASGYDAENAPAPIVVGHPKTDDPAFGWCAAFSFNEDTQRLIADSGDLDEAFASSVEGGAYRKVSMALFSPEHPANPKPGQYYPRHLGFLGAAAPAVTGLKPVHFDDGGPIIEIEFADAPGWAVRDAFRRMRDYFIGKFGLEDADKMLPDYLVEATDPEDPAPSPNYLAPPPAPTPIQPENDDMTPEQKAALEKLQADNLALTAQLEQARIATATAGVTAFCSALVEQKRLTPAEVPAVSAALVAVESLSAVEFSTGEGATAATAKKTPGEILRGILQARNPIVSDREQTDPDDVTPAFTTGPKAGVDPEAAAVHAKVLAYQATHSGTTYETALQAVVAG